MYIAGATTVATIFTAFIASQVCTLSLRQIDGRLQGTSDTNPLNRRWRVILNIGSLKENFRYPSSRNCLSLDEPHHHRYCHRSNTGPDDSSLPVQPQDFLWAKSLLSHTTFVRCRTGQPGILLGPWEWKRILYTSQCR